MKSEVRNATAQLVRLDAYEAPIDDGWREAFSYGTTRHPVKDFVVDERFCAKMVQSFEYLRDEYGYYPPIAVEHKYEIDFDELDKLGPIEVDGEEIPLTAILDEQGKISEGITWGIISDVRHRKGEGLDVWPRYVPAAEALRKLGLLLYVSPSFFPEWKDPHTGAVLENALREFTHCGIPHQKNLSTPAVQVYALSEQGFTTTQTAEADMEEELADIKKLLADLAAAVSDLAGGGEEAEMEEEAELMETEMSEDVETSETVDNALRKEVAELKAQIAEKDALPGIVEELKCSAEQARKLAPLKLHNAAAYKVVQELASRETSVNNTETERPMRGQTQNAPAQNSATNDALVMSLAEEAASKGIARRDFPAWATQQAGAKGISASEVASAIRPELITPAYSVARKGE